MTPWDGQGSIDLAAVRRNMQGYGGAPVVGYVVGGAPGEFAYLSPSQQQELVAMVVEEGEGRPGIAAPVGALDVAGWQRTGAAALLVDSPPEGWACTPPLLLHLSAAVDRHAVASVLRRQGMLGVVGDDAEAVATGLALIRSGQVVGTTLAEPDVGARMLLSTAAAALPYEVSAWWSSTLRIEQASWRQLLRWLGAHGVAGIRRAMDLLGYRGGPVRPGGRRLTAAQERALHSLLLRCGLVRR